MTTNELPQELVVPCDRCIALGTPDECGAERFTVDNVWTSRQHEEFDNCTDTSQVRTVSEGLNWADWALSEYRTIIYCENWIRYCEWHGDWFAVPMLGHELQFSPIFRAAVRDRVIRGWNIGYVVNPNEHYDSHENNESVCLSCYENGSSCDCCDERFSDNYNFTSVNYGEAYVCEECFDDHYTYCDEHDNYHHYEVVCRSCDQEERDGGGFIHSYGYKPDPQFKVVPDELPNWDKRKIYDNAYHRRSSGRFKYQAFDGSGYTPINSKADPMVFLGFELEVEAPYSGGLGDGARMLGQGWSEFLYLKQDGSLTNGMEIVSHPMTLRAHKELVDWSYLDKLRDYGFLSFRTNTCGLHVHINRASFDSDTHMYKFAKLFANNPIPMQRLGGRDSSRWGSFTGSFQEGIRAGIKQEYGLNRYQAVNFCNSNTLELRFFKGTLRKERVISALELADAAVEYTRQLPTLVVILNGGFKFSHFAQWVIEQPQYPNLAYFINTFGLLGSEDTSWSNHDSSNEMEV